MGSHGRRMGHTNSSLDDDRGLRTMNTASPTITLDEALSVERNAKIVKSMLGLVEKLQITSDDISVLDRLIDKNYVTDTPSGDLRKDNKNKRLYRRKDQLPNPEAPNHAEVNRTKKNITLRFSDASIEKMNQKAKEAGISRQEWVEMVLLPHLE